MDPDRHVDGQRPRHGSRAGGGPARRPAAERYARWTALGAVVAIVAGVVVLVVAHGVAASVAAIVLLGVGGIALVSVAFLLVGAGEERDRDQRPRG